MLGQEDFKTNKPNSGSCFRSAKSVERLSTIPAFFLNFSSCFCYLTTQFSSRSLVRMMTDTLRPPSLQVSVPSDAPAYLDGRGNTVSDGSMRSSSSTPTLRRKRFKMRRMRNVPSEKESERDRLNVGHLSTRSHSASKEYLQLPSIEITPSSDEDATSTWSRCSTPSASPRRKRFLLRKWLKVREKKEQSSDSRLVWTLPIHLSTSSRIPPCCIKASALCSNIWVPTC